MQVRLSQTSIRLMVDEEVNRTNPLLLKNYVYDTIETGKKYLKSLFPSIDVTLHHSRSDMQFRSGHDRQQFMMFYADSYCTSEYVGFIDSDALIHSYVDREDIFDRNKPIIHGRIGKLKNHGADRNKRWWAASSFKAIGLEEPMVCMSYFPIVVKREHLKEIREYIRVNMKKKSFEEAFREISKKGIGTFSQFNIICSYLWWMRRHHYSWVIHDTAPWYDGFKHEVIPYIKIFYSSTYINFEYIIYIYITYSRTYKFRDMLTCIYIQTNIHTHIHAYIHHA